MIYGDLRNSSKVHKDIAELAIFRGDLSERFDSHIFTIRYNFVPRVSKPPKKKFWQLVHSEDRTNKFHLGKIISGSLNSRMIILTLFGFAVKSILSSVSFTVLEIVPVGVYRYPVLNA